MAVDYRRESLRNGVIKTIFKRRDALLHYFLMTSFWDSDEVGFSVNGVYYNYLRVLWTC